MIRRLTLSSLFLSITLLVGCTQQPGGVAEADQVVSPAPTPSGAEAVPAGAVAGNAATTPAVADPAAGEPAVSPKPDAGGARLAKVFPVKGKDWPMWGGNPSRNMVNPSETVVAKWDVESGENVRWKAQLGSQSYGNPSIGGNRVLVGTNNQAERNPAIKGDKGIVMCFQKADGKFLWQAVHDKLEAGRVNDWPEQGICSSPVIDGDRAWYVSNRAEVVCIDLKGFADGNTGPYKDEKYTSPIDGDFIWVLDMIEELGVFPHNLATCSPIVVGDIVYLITANGVERDHITIPSPRSPSFLAVNKNTGEVVWESNAPGEDILHGQWSAPAFIHAGGRDQIIMPGGDGWVRSFDPIKGDEIWKFDCNPKDSVWKLGGKGTRNAIIATPVCVNGNVYVAVGQDPEHGEGIGHFYSIDASKTGDITDTGRNWHYGGKDFRRTISSCAVHDGLIYAADLSGFLHCIDEKTGKPYWVHDTLAAVWGSPTVIGDKVFLGDEDGDIVVLKTGKKMEVVFETNMENSVYTGPVASDGVLYLASRTTLYAIGK